MRLRSSPTTLSTLFGSSPTCISAFSFLDTTVCSRTALSCLFCEQKPAQTSKITHIVDLRCNRIVVFGDDEKRVDVFNVSLTKANLGGSAIIEYAVSEMALLISRPPPGGDKAPAVQC
jgi:hypothetical protein